MKVLIVDDEMKVSQLILHLIHWEDFGLEVIGIANDGQKAYEMICDQKPDIVITDIRMPSLSGIELVEKSLEAVGNIYFVIISGYSQFEYAQQAVKLGVEDYLLKPIKKKELEAVLNKIIHKHRETTKDETERETLKIELSQTREKVKSNLLTELIVNKREEIALLGRTELKERFGCSLDGKYYRFVIAHLYTNLVEDNNDENSFIMPKIQKSIREKLEKYCREFISIIYEDEVICLLNTDEACEEELARQLKRVKVDIANIHEIFPFARVAIGVGREMDDLRQGKDSIRGIQIAMLRRFEQEEKFLFWEEKCEKGKVSVSDIITANIRKKFLMEIELINGEAVEQMIRETGNKIEGHLEDGMLIEACCGEIIDLFLFGVKSYLETEDLPSAEYLKKGYHSFYSFHEGIEWLARQCREIITRYEQNQKAMEAKPIRMAKEYIAEHYGESISLEMVSNYIGFNPAYFSSIFKKTTNQNFMDFVTEVRIDNAKILIAGSDKDIAEIACEVGYSDIKYFSKVFKKYTSLSPSEYRKLYS